jgi:gamma-glutamyltranspeptidase/glutathione hydrolase
LIRAVFIWLLDLAPFDLFLNQSGPSMCPFARKGGLCFYLTSRCSWRYAAYTMKPRLLASFVLSLLLPTAGWPQSVPEAASHPVSTASETPVRAQHAMVVSVHHLAADAGVEILKAGGNAVDAAVATGFALSVVYPFAGNLGGGGFMLIHLKTGKNTFIDYREEAPGSATANMYLDAKGNVIPNASTIGYKAIGVPGSVAGMAYAEKKYGKLDLAKVMAPAIRLATDGFQLTEDEAKVLADPHLADFPETRRIFTRNGDRFKPGDTLRQPELAKTLTRIAANPDDFYHGEIAHTLVADLSKEGGLISLDDLAKYEPKERTPLEGDYEGLTIVSAPPPSSGGVTLLETLNILSGYNLAHLGDRTPAQMHLVLEAYRRAYMDRNEYLGDPDFVSIPLSAMLDPKYAAAWRASIVNDEASPSATLKRPAGFLPPPPTAPAARTEASDTTHYSVVDDDGNAVAVTTTLNGAFGSYVTAEGLGFLLNDEMDDFTTKAGVPNMFGLIQGPANAIAPGKRPLSSMTPTIVLDGSDRNDANNPKESKPKKVRYVLGSPGGSRIITIVGGIFLGLADGGLNIQDAVDAPRFHHQYLPDTVYLEPGFPPSTTEGLRALGYNISAGATHWGDGECIAVDPNTGVLEGGQDHRHHFGKAAGY